MTLTTPTPSMKQAALAYRQEFADHNETYIHGSRSLHQFDDYESWLEKIANVITFQENDRVNSSTYFATDDGEIIGATNIRHTLNDRLRHDGGHIGYSVRPSQRRKGYATKILALALEKCYDLGIREVLVTCNKDNIGSAKTIVNNGGVLDSEFLDENGDMAQRYWITLPTIRPEQPKDHRIVEELTRAAFTKPDRTEHYMVHQLRKKDGIMSLNFVAEIGTKIVGHIIYSKAHILKADGTKIDVLNFGPLSVLPEMQKLGIGSALMRYSIEEARKQGHGAILFFGHSEYYPRFGFAEAKEFGVTTHEGKNFPAFMAMELVEGYLKNAAGKYIEADIYDDNANREQAREFDKSFT